MHVIGVQGMWVYTNDGNRFDVREFSPQAKEGDIIEIMDGKPVVTGRQEESDCDTGGCPVR